MHTMDNQKYVIVTSPRVINDNTAYTTNTVDSKGWRRLRFLIILGALDIAVATLKLTESNDSGMSGATDVPGEDFSVSPATLPSATDDDKLFAIDVRCAGKRKRYFDLSFTAGDGAAGTYAAVVAILDEAEILPSTAADRGFAQQLRV